MNRAIAVFLSMIQSLDVPWRVLVTFLAAVMTAGVVLFVFLPLFLSLTKLLLGYLRKILVAVTNFCMKKWGRLVIRSRKRKGKFPQFLVAAEDFFVRVVTGVSRFLDGIIQWKPPYGAISVRIVLISCILLVLLTVALWVIPASNGVLTAVFIRWEREYLMVSPGEAAPVVALQPDRSIDAQVYYTLSGESANFRKSPDGEVITKLNDSGLLLRYLGKTEGQWLKVECFEENQRVVGWIHETMVSRWNSRRNSLEYLEPGTSLRLSASGIPIFTCELIGFREAENGMLQILLKE